MLHFLSRVSRPVARHWGKLLILVLVAGAALAVAVSPALQDRVQPYWHAALLWAGLAETETESDTIYWCPMHPQIKRKNPNEVCPICNMALVPLASGSVEAPEHLTLTPRQVQQAGVVYEPVVRRELYREIDTTGRIESDERREAKITSWVRGKSRIEKLYIDFTGARVEKGQVMAELYSPELIVAQQDYLLTIQRPEIPGVDLAGATRQKLRDQGLTGKQIEELTRTRQVVDRIPISAPISGTVIHRNVQEGQYVAEGDVLFHISDLTHVWVFADIYEEELPLVEVGQPVEITVRSFPSAEFEGEVSFIDPVLNRASRTIRVRIEAPNPHRLLKPGMFAGVRLSKELGTRLAIPANAVLRSGERQVALVKQGKGMFEPREIRIESTWLYPAEPKYKPGGGLEFGEGRIRYHELLSGVSPGEQVVTAGAFLLNAESQFQSVLTKMLPPQSESATLEQAVGEEVAQGIRGVLDDYYGLSQALAEDRLEAVPSAAEALAQSSAKLARQSDAENMSQLSGQAERLAELARRLTEDGPADLHAARVAFGRISRSLVSLMAENGGQTLFGKDLFLFECGMAKVGYENWLWWSPEKFNPYMGQKMLQCGTQLKTLQP